MEQKGEVEAFKQFEHDGWEQSVAAYDHLFGSLTAQMITPLIGELKPTKGEKLLDIATGPGYVAAKGRDCGCVVSAIDISEAMIARAREAFPQDIDFRVGDAEALLFGEAAFDVITMNFGMLHLAQPGQAAREACQALKPGGRFGFTVWAQPELSTGFSIILRAIEAHGNPTVRLPAGPPFFHYSNREQGIGLLTAAGFVSPQAQLTHLTWRLPNADSLFEAFYEGTARTGGNLRAQPEENRERIRRAVREDVARYERAGSVEIPMAAWVYIGEKSASRGSGIA
jgi:ubiquinone/menaquinone biosynthesis C-methylase UbiE